MLKKLLLLSAFVVGGILHTIAGAYTYAYSATLIGTWMRQDKQCYVTIYAKGDKYYGKITWLKNPSKDGKPVMDKHNNKPLIGMEVLQDFTYQGHKTWGDGKIYEPTAGKDHSSKLKLIDYNTLEVHDYTGLPFFGGQDETWKRVK